ncbi:MAG: hypothetical protein P3W93_008005 [Thermus sp.]|nr:hypothetical protein [Thermus sp.]
MAAALVHDPPVLFLDEPTLGVDLEAQEAIRSWLLQLKAEGKAILLTTHQLDLAQALADRVVILLEGEVALEGRTQEVLQGSPRAPYRVELARPLEDGWRLAILLASGARLDLKPLALLPLGTLALGGLGLGLMLGGLALVYKRVGQLLNLLQFALLGLFLVHFEALAWPWGNLGYLLPLRGCRRSLLYLKYGFYT